ncbi:MAG: DUF559 domain-containing protein, partial [Clostridia bacterium]|nr:DUF559 domain-containing protein [Clostridia bacterium]
GVVGIVIIDVRSIKLALIFHTASSAVEGSQALCGSLTRDYYEDKGVKADRERDSVLSSLGLTVLRYSNLDVNSNFAGVCEDILLHLK